MKLKELVSSGVLAFAWFHGAAFAMGKKPPQEPQTPAVDPGVVVLPTDPYTTTEAPRADDVDYSANIRIINHGVTDIPKDTVPRLIHAVERIYSQCDGVRFHVNVLGIEQAPYTTAQDDIVDPSGPMSLGQGFENFFTKFPNNPTTGEIDVHLFDFLEKSVRDEYKRHEDATDEWLGQAFPASLMDNLWRDVRPEQERVGKLSEIGGNTIRLGMDMLNEVQGQQNHINDGTDWRGRPKIKLAWRSYHWSVLAHEMGHILMDPQTGKGLYIDHYCPALHATCGRDNLMSSGGYPDMQYVSVPDMKRVIGYSPLPALEPAQCEVLMHNPLVKRW